MNLSDAIAAVESAESAYQGATSQTSIDQGVVSAAQAKLDLANTQLAGDQVAQTDAAAVVNKSLDDLIAAATAAKIAV